MTFWPPYVFEDYDRSSWKCFVTFLPLSVSPKIDHFLWYYEHNNWTGTMLPLSSSGQIMALFILDCVCEQVREIRLSVNI